LRFEISRETGAVYAITSIYLLLFPFLFGSASLSLPLIPAAFIATKFKENRVYSQIFALGVFGDLFFTSFPFGFYTIFLMLSCYILSFIRKFLFVDTIFSLAIFTCTLSFLMNMVEMSYLSIFGDGQILPCLWQKDFLFDPIKQGLFALFAYTLPLLGILPKHEKTTKLFSLK
jgi:cell shape-determining protein MreD